MRFCNNEAVRRTTRVLGYVKPYWAVGAVVLALRLLHSAGGFVSPLLEKQFVDLLTTPQAGSDPWMSVVYVVLGMVALGVGLQVVRILDNFTSYKLYMGTKQALVTPAIGQIFRTSLGQHQEESVGKMINRLDRGINGINDAMFDVVANLLTNIVFLVAAVYLMFHLDTRLALVAVSFTVVTPVISYFAGKIAAKREQKIMDEWGGVYARLYEALNLIKTVKAFCMESTEIGGYLTKVRKVYNTITLGARTDASFGAAKDTVALLAKMSVYGYGAYLVLHGQTTLGTVIAIAAYTGNLFGPMLDLVGMYETLQKVAVHLGVIFEFIDKESKVAEKASATELSDVRGEVTFDEVSFSYKEDKGLLKGVSFHAHRGQTVALVGPSGAGKTTLCDLLCRFYDPTAGAVKIDGVDIRDVTLQSLRSSIGVVLQDTALFNDTVRNNIAFARPDATDEEVRRAARIARADVFIDELTDKYESNVGERGCKLSAGQRQRISIARAVLADPAILIFDEATCNLDAESERLVQKALQELGKTKTIFVIAHRLSTIRHADQILVVKDGEIAERGTHNTLMARGGIYSGMVLEQQLGETPEKTLSPDLACAAA